MPRETTSTVAADGIGNLAFYRMCAEFPANDNVEQVFDKLLFIARVYSVARGLRGNWAELSKAIVKKTDDVDRRIEAAKRKAFPANMAAALEAHEFLDRIVCKTLRKCEGVAEQVHGRPSLVSKYLHFHAPDAFPILDADATRGLIKLTPGFRTSLDDPRPYDRFCERFAHFVRENGLRKMSLRHIDNELLRIGRGLSGLKPNQNWPSHLP